MTASKYPRDILARRKRAKWLRRRGWTYERIAQALGLANKACARRIVLWGRKP